MSFADHPNRRWLLFLGWLACSIAISWTAFATLLRYSFGNDDASHILLIPFICAWLMFIDRGRIFTSPSSDVAVCLVLLVPGVAIILSSIKNSAVLTIVMRVWLGDGMDRGFRTSIWQRGAEGRTISVDVPVSLYSTTGSTPQSSGLFSSEGLNGNISTAVCTDTPASSPRGFRVSSAALQH